MFERLEITFNTPRLKRIIGPGTAFVRVALDAGVRTACGERNIGPWNAHAVIAARINAHVYLRRHMTIYAGASTATHRMTMVALGIIGLGLVALSAYAASFCNECIAVWVVTVTANHTRLRHFALHERAIDINFIANLSVVPVQWRLQY